MTSITSLLIANRGEIAIRIARAASELGITSTAVFSRDDADSPHLIYADRAVPLAAAGPAAFLDQHAIIDAALAAGCDAIHPGYGFLAENAVFAQACAERGLMFVGPSPDALALFGDKVRARRLAIEQDVPLLPGTADTIGVAEARAFLASLGGAPMMVKAIAGGGGRGIRIIDDPTTLERDFTGCAEEARKAFGDPALYCERFVARARHIEVQVLGDGQKGLVHLGERECSLQRRHQKMIEIAPVPDLPLALTTGLRAAALRMAAATDYRGLCTFEFLVDADGGNDFWFMEANPRVQVEHTVTEQVTGIDLVTAQIRVAGGASLADLGIRQETIPLTGAMAIQLRLNAEVPGAAGTIRPTHGRIGAIDLPAGPGVRVDGCARAGYAPNPAFDSLLAKIVVTQPGAPSANLQTRLIDRARRVLLECRVSGIDTNAALLAAILAMPAVRSGNSTTRLVEANWDMLVEEASALAHRFKLDAGDVDVATEPMAEQALDPGIEGLRAPMAGVLTTILASAGDVVANGQSLAFLEAMKMEHALVAPCAGRIVSAPNPNLVVRGGELLFRIARDDAAVEIMKSAATADLKSIPPLLAEEHARRARRLDAARPDAVAQRHATGKRMLRANIADLADPDSFVEYGGLALASQRRRRDIDTLASLAPADGMVAGTCTINGDQFPHASRCVVIGYDYTVFAGTQGWANHRKLERMLGIAARDPQPLILFAEGGGGRAGDTDQMRSSGLDTGNFARLARLSGRAPLIGIASGSCFAGNAALLGCSDVIIATADASIGMGGPAMIEGGGLGSYAAHDVGPLAIQVPNGVVDVVASDEADAVAKARRYLSYFQGDLPPPVANDQRALRHFVPENRNRTYDVRRILETLVDPSSTLELRSEFGVGIRTILARIGGRAVAVLANNNQHLSGAIDSVAADKAARFIRLSELFGLPVVSLCDTPGFMVGPDSERTAAVRHLSRLFLAGANVSVPWITVVLRRGYGLGAMAMAGGGMHEGLATLAWPTAEFGGMGLEGAVRLGHRRELAEIADPAERARRFDALVGALYEAGKAHNAASYVEIDDVIDPADTRDLILKSLQRRVIAPVRRPYLDSW